MRFLPLPRSAIRSVAVATAVLLAWLAWGTAKYPEAFWAPGDLSRYHADITTCAGCHQPFRGAVAGQCITCHGGSRFAVQPKSGLFESHQKLMRAGKSCSGCHTEHRGAQAQITIGVGRWENP
ncbi:MAG: cytochrome c3 family protein [Methylococcaceae bacterium]|nr:cytochrome c3 family protein [Methylococcaceae bacterium]